MRDIALTIILLGIIPLIFFRPHVGVLAWAWVSLMNPHREVYSFLNGANLNLFFAGLTLISLILSREKRLPHLNPTLLLITIFVAWTTLTTFTALNYELSSEYWLRNIKTFVFLVIIVTLIDRPSRIHSLVLVIVVSIGYWGIISAVRTVASLGYSRLGGPPGSMIADNNTLALALVMVLPLVEYCRYVSSNVWVRNASITALVCLVLAILGTYSRGGLISLVAVLAVFWWKSRSRLLAAGIIGISVISMVMLPQQWSERMGTLKTYQEDPSFQQRIGAWTTALRIGLDRPIIGAGYKATEDPAIYAHYKSEGDTIKSKAVHNAYLQVLAEHGFVGLGVFALIIFFAVRNCRWVIKRCSNKPDMYWLVYLASMLEIGFVGYAVGAVALSVAYYDLFLVFIVISSIIRDYARRELKNSLDTENDSIEAVYGARPKTEPLESV